MRSGGDKPAGPVYPEPVAEGGNRAAHVAQPNRRNTPHAWRVEQGRRVTAGNSQKRSDETAAANSSLARQWRFPTSSAGSHVGPHTSMFVTRRVPGLLVALLLMCLCLCVGAAISAKPLKIVVSNAPSGVADITARTVGRSFPEALVNQSSLKTSPVPVGSPASWWQGGMPMGHTCCC